MRDQERINLYVGNHGKPSGIEDYINNLRYMFTSRGFDFSVSSDLQKGRTNIIIDEFANFDENRRIVDFFSHNPDSPLVFVLTEFIETRFGVTSFNHFGGLIESALLVLISLYLRIKRVGSKWPAPARLFRRIVCVPLYVWHACHMVLHALINPQSKRTGRPAEKKGTGSRLRWMVYMHMRYLGLEAMAEYAQGIILSHDGILPGLRKRFPALASARLMGTFYPEFRMADVGCQTLQNKAPCVEITGTITPYRAALVDVINASVRSSGLEQTFGQTRCYSFDQAHDGEARARGAFSLHPPQSENWRYSSPTRIYRALCVDGSIPFLTKSFQQHPIEEVCLLFKGDESIRTMYELYTKKALLDAYLKERVEPYLAIAGRANDELCRKIRQCASS